MIGKVVLEIGLSLLLGILAGMALKFMARYAQRREAILMVILGTLFIIIGVATLLGASALLANMVMGFIIVNWKQQRHEFFGGRADRGASVWPLFWSGQSTY